MGALRFECQAGCTKCCRTKGYVYLTAGDLPRAASHVGVTPQAFEARYVYRTRHLLRLRKPRHRQCHFLEAGGCALHPDKPTQCRAYPFWPELIGSAEAWREAGEICPGIGQGPLISIQAATRIAGEMREVYPGMYGD